MTAPGQATVQLRLDPNPLVSFAQQELPLQDITGRQDDISETVRGSIGFLHKYSKDYNVVPVENV